VLTVCADGLSPGEP
jgi:hypothetical protein